MQLESVRVARRDLKIALVNVILVGAQIAEPRHSRIRMIAEVAHQCSADVEAQTGPAVGIDLDDSAEIPRKSRQAGGLVSAAEPGYCFLVVNEPGRTLPKIPQCSKRSPTRTPIRPSTIPLDPPCAGNRLTVLSIPMTRLKLKVKFEPKPELFCRHTPHSDFRTGRLTFVYPAPSS